MFAGYSISYVAAYEEVDGRRRDSLINLTPEQRCEREMKNIILTAQKEHEDRIHQQVIAAMKQRADQELAKRRDMNPFPQSLIRDPMVDDEEVQALLDLVASMEDYETHDYDDIEEDEMH
ncbi:uncharacterized protein LOC110185113 [Drosophila serrata]|uniref:uncharacterized protein LOC110185113 n=1 Tax=Drosophila serrata TaxID=7274 RepID=UPI000A1D084B|nr:uncharacterized protein LOC110185113 [Drosophila serrata]KAH8356948.1 hypothetical protein KR200_005859 [Drosophila serrata]